MSALTERQERALVAVAACPPTTYANGWYLSLALSTSKEGAHQTAASLDGRHPGR